MIANVLIVDDEPGSRSILRKYIKDIPALHLLGECKDAFEASEAISKEKVDILLLDINMPRLSGISFAQSLTAAPLIIFTTAYPEYAVEGFELNALDYLVKPFSFERFLKAINKGINVLSKLDKQNTSITNIIVRSDKKIYVLKNSEIVFIEGCGDYIKLVLEGGKHLIVHETMKGFAGRINKTDIIRIHKSFAVNLSHINYIEGNQIITNAGSIPMSETYRTSVMEQITSNLRHQSGSSS